MNIGLGTAALGRPHYINIKTATKATSEVDLSAFKDNAFKVLEKAYKLGVRYFDTAPGYGLSENLLLEWLRTKQDKSIEIATKWGYTYVANFNPNAKVHEVKEHSLEKLNEQWKISMGFIPHLKVYQIHSTTLETGVLKNEAVLNRLAFLKREYQIKIGITTTGSNQVEVINKALDISINGKQLFDVFQVTYNMLDQSLQTISHKFFEQDKKLVIKEALANGRVFRNKNYSHYSNLYNKLEAMAKKYQVGIDAIALQFCSRIFPKSIVLSGASNLLQLSENLKMNTFELTKEELIEISEFRIDPNEYWLERKLLSWN